MDNHSQPKNKRSRTVIFCAVHVLLIASGVSWATVRYQAWQADRELPVPRNEPLQVNPLYNDPDVVSDEQLISVLTILKPKFRHAKPKINHVDHALRFWGVEAVFDDPECLSGVEMRELLLDHRQFARAWGAKTDPFLIDESNGVRLRTQEGLATASHVDHTLAGLAEVGTPLDYPVITSKGERRLRDILMNALGDFSLNQTEYEWSALAFALYLPPAEHFYSSEGQKITFDMLAERIMRQRLVQGVCRGNHRLHALVVLLRVDEQVPILSDSGRMRIIDYLQDVTRRFVENQNSEGYFERRWPGSEWDGPQRKPEKKSDQLVDRLLVTGHVMEWWSLAPPDVQPPREVVVKAGQWLCQTIEGLSDRQVKSHYTFLSHAGRALALWRGTFPAEVMRDSQ